MSHAVSTLGHAEHDHSHDDGTKTVYGFWIYLMSDLLIFSVLFATFAVLSGATAGGPSGKSLFDLSFVLVETFVLLISSFTFGMAMLNMHAGHARKVITWLGVTFFLGAIFLSLEIYEFAHLINQGAGPQRSAYLSAFFALVGTHGLHVAAGMLWILVMMDMVRRYGLDGINRRRLACLSLFWHFLDIVWICVFTFVYLMGAL